MNAWLAKAVIGRAADAQTVGRDTMSRSRLCSVKEGGGKEATTPGVFPPVPQGCVLPSRR